MALSSVGRFGLPRYRHVLLVLTVAMGASRSALGDAEPSLSPPPPPPPPPNEQPLVLFVPHDAGESNSFLPVANALASDRTVQLVVLALGQPAGDIFAGFPGRVVALRGLGINVTVIDQSRRDQLLQPADLAILTQAFEPPPALVVVGAVYAMQAQIAAAFPHALGPGKVRTVALLDGFAEWSPTRGFVTGAILNQSTSVVDSVFVTDDAIGHTITAFAKEQIPPLRINVVTTGSPALASWASISANASAVFATRRLLYGDDPKPAVLYAGGYGAPEICSADYSAAVELFAGLVNMTVNGVNDTLWSFSPHPRFNGSCERGIFEDFGLGDVIADVPARTGTALATAASNASLSQGSTVGPQTLYIGRPTGFLQPPADAGDESSNVFTRDGMIPIAYNGSAAAQVLQGFRDRRWHFLRRELEGDGIPTNATARMAAAILAAAKLAPSPTTDDAGKTSIFDLIFAGVVGATVVALAVVMGARACRGPGHNQTWGDRGQRPGPYEDDDSHAGLLSL